MLTSCCYPHLCTNRFRDWRYFYAKLLLLVFLLLLLLLQLLLCCCCLLLWLKWREAGCCAVRCCLVRLFCSWWWVDYSSNYLSAFWYYSSFMRSKWDQLLAIHAHIHIVHIYMNLLPTDHRTLAHSTDISIKRLQNHSSSQLTRAQLSSA